VVSLELYRPEYVLVGLLWTFLLLLPLIVYSETTGVLFIGKWVFFKDSPVSFPIFFLVGFYLSLSLFMQFISDDFGILTLKGLIPFFVIVFSMVAFFSLNSGDFRSFLEQFGFRRVTTPSPPPKRSDFVSVSWVLLQMLLSLILYSIFVFPHLQREFGGGKPPEVELVLSAGTKLPWSADGLPMSNDGLTIGPVLLLMETEKTVVVASVIGPGALFGLIAATSDAFVLNKDVIVAYRYIRPHSPTSCYAGSTVK
jgi:hypothetical protein